MGTLLGLNIHKSLHCGTKRPGADDLAKRAQWSDILRPVKVVSIMVLGLAQSNDIVMMMKQLSGEEMDAGGKQHAGHQAAEPRRSPKSLPPLHVAVSILVVNSTNKHPLMSALYFPTTFPVKVVMLALRDSLLW